MTIHSRTRTCAQVLVDQLRLQGVTRALCVPGESYLPVLDALHDSGIAITVCRTKAALDDGAEAWGKQTGRLGISLRSPAGLAPPMPPAAFISPSRIPRP